MTKVALHSRGDTSPHVQWTTVLLSEALLARDADVCLEHPAARRTPAFNESYLESSPRVRLVAV